MTRRPARSRAAGRQRDQDVYRARPIRQGLASHRPLERADARVHRASPGWRSCVVSTHLRSLPWREFDRLRTMKRKDGVEELFPEWSLRTCIFLEIFGKIQPLHAVMVLHFENEGF